MKMKIDVVVIQIGMKDFEMKVNTLPRLKQDSKIRDSCRKVLKTLEKVHLT